MKVITYDIEVSPLKAWMYGTKWEPKLVKIIEQQKILSFAYKVLGEKKTHVIANIPEKKMLKEIWGVLDDCDIAIGHNVDKFDRRMMNAFFLRAGMKPPSPYHTIDTLKIARRHFYLPSNSLKDVAIELGLNPKLDCGFELVEGCMAGDTKAWKAYKAYNKRDVTLTEEIYIILRPWDTNPVSITAEEGACTSCGGHSLKKKGTRLNKSGTQEYQRYRCGDCGAWKQETRGIKTGVSIK